MNLQSLIQSAVDQFVAGLTKSLKPNEAAAVRQIVEGLLALIEAEAVNRGGPALLADLSKQYPALAAVIAQAPQLAALLPAAI
jgi:hypothetical protein